MLVEQSILEVGILIERERWKHFPTVHDQVLYASGLGLSFFSRYGGTHSGLIDEISTLFKLSCLSLGRFRQTTSLTCPNISSKHVSPASM
jgi:hypothetical protein